MKRRILICVLTLAMGNSIFAIGLTSTLKPQLGEQHKKRAGLTALQREAIKGYGPGVQIVMDHNAVPSYLMGQISPRSSRNDVAAAQEALDAHGPAFRRRAEDGFDFRVAIKDDLDMKHIRMTQTYKGLPVVGGELIVHLTKNMVVGINGRFVPDLDLESEPSISAEGAASAAVASVESTGGTNPNVVGVSGPVIFMDEADSGHLAIPVRVTYAGDEGLEVDDIFVDAVKGSVLGRHALAWRALFRRIFNGNQSCNFGTLPGTFMFQEGGSSADSGAMGAYNHSGTAYRFFLNEFQHDSFNNAGAQIISTVHFRFPSSCTPNNAMWVNNQLVFGDGDGFSFSNLANDLDIVAHELTHGVTQFTSNLTYNRESGALNEAASDILGECASNSVGQSDWKIGASSFTPGFAGDALRFMYDPALDGSSADFYPHRLFPGNCTPSGNNDNCGVHSNSGIANLFFYLLSQGGSHPRGKTSVVVPAIGIQKAQRIWYRALVAYMTPSTNFQGARAATASAAADLFGGTCTSEWQAVHKAWDAVGVPGGWSCGPPPPQTCDPDGSKQAQCFSMGGIHFDSSNCMCCTSFQITDCFIIE